MLTYLFVREEVMDRFSAVVSFSLRTAFFSLNNGINSDLFYNLKYISVDFSIYSIFYIQKEIKLQSIYFLSSVLSLFLILPCSVRFECFYHLFLIHLLIIAHSLSMWYFVRICSYLYTSFIYFIDFEDLLFVCGMMTVLTAMQFMVQCIELNRSKLKMSSTHEHSYSEFGLVVRLISAIPRTRTRTHTHQILKFSKPFDLCTRIKILTLARLRLVCKHLNTFRSIM